jgi:outer membrane protein assembly factor BamD
MSKPDRDTQQALRSEQECKQLVLQYPNSKFVPEAEQLLRNIDEVLAEGEMASANFYFGKGSRSAAANRYSGLVQQYPLYSRADEALWKDSEEYLGLGGAKFRSYAGQALQKIVRDYPLSIYADQAKKKLRELEMEVPEADPAAVARMKYEQDNRTKPSTFKAATGFLRPGPDVSMAAKTGSPAMNPPKQNVPVNVPTVGAVGAAGFQGDVTVAPVTNASGTATPAAGATASVDGSKPTDKPTDKPADAAATTNSAKADAASKKGAKNPKQDPVQTPAAAPAATPAPDPGPKP